ncbi:GntR family transcriptional regulator [Lysinibacillus halotolerans]|uniref:GntR family transcriptional regulator n=1 Tax=Lysinibacillus halotolerans TaxID=1368476 RepID=A0A3M8H6I5_9BACI|nr:GntR family transcriptional regulator [Lysinibacillus halotolerans]RNC97993.1 GntR family transcriptional regulator [Lysinibacillus halotolerans]
MNLKQESNTPIYIQIAEWIENEIIADQLLENGKVFSQYQLAEMFNINPATAGKGLAILLENGILYKKRGLGMFVQEGSKELILSKRHNEKLSNLAKEIVEEAKRLFVSDSELIELIKKIQREG